MRLERKLQKSTITKSFTMFNSISWSQYVTVIITSLILYYCFIGFKYFRWEILSLIGIKRIDDKDIAIPVAEIKKHYAASNHADYLPKNPDEAIAMLQPFWDEVNAYLAEMNSVAPNEEILFALKMILEKYSGLQNDEYRKEVETATSGLLNQYFPERFKAADIQYIRV